MWEFECCFFRSRGKLCFIYIYSNEYYVPAGDESEQILCKKSALSTLNQFQQNLCLYYRVFLAQARPAWAAPTLRFSSCIFAKSPRQLDALGASSRVENRDKSSLIEFIRYSICCAGTFFRVAKESSWSSHDERQPHAAGISRREESLRIWVSLFFSIFLPSFFRLDFFQLLLDRGYSRSRLLFSLKAPVCKMSLHSAECRVARSLFPFLFASLFAVCMLCCYVVQSHHWRD